MWVLSYIYNGSKNGRPRIDIYNCKGAIAGVRISYNGKRWHSTLDMYEQVGLIQVSFKRR